MFSNVRITLPMPSHASILLFAFPRRRRVISCHDAIGFLALTIGSQPRTAVAAQVTECVRTSGWRQCTHLAVSWLDQPIS